MASKRYKGRDCAYCGRQKVSATADHVIAREFFFEADRGNLPQVPACDDRNNKKSALEHYATAILMMGSNHFDGNVYRREKVVPCLSKNKELQHEMGVNAPPILMNVRGVIQPLHTIKVHPYKIRNLMALIAKGLYYFHFGKPLNQQFYADVGMFSPDTEAALWASVADYFPPQRAESGS